MDLYFDDDTVLRELRRYVRLVNEDLGLTGDCWYVQADDVVSAYIALDRRLRRFPDRDVALLWEERLGWSAAIETHSGEDLLVVAYLGRDVLPAPAVVAAWVRDLFDRHRSFGQPAPVVPPVCGVDGGGDGARGAHRPTRAASTSSAHRLSSARMAVSRTSARWTRRVPRE